MNSDTLKRRCLLWLSRADIVGVRNKFIQLYLAPEDYIPAAPPEGTFGIGEVRISCRASILVMAFDLLADKSEITYIYYLKCPKNENPYWERQSSNEELIQRLDFNDTRARIVSELVKHYSKHFPFMGTDNYLSANGGMIA